MRPHVPPDLLGVVDAVGLDQQVDEALVVGPAREGVGDVGARKLVEHLAAIRLEPGVEADPERRVGGQREQVRQEVAHLVHQVDAPPRDPRCRRARAGRRSGSTAPPAACLRRPAGSARRDRCPARASRRTGAWRRRTSSRPFSLASFTIARRRLMMSARASFMLRQTPVPTSTTDWCISALMRSSSWRLPFEMISALMCERRSNVAGSIVWYSSSIPMVKEGVVI